MGRKKSTNLDLSYTPRWHRCYKTRRRTAHTLGSSWRLHRDSHCPQDTAAVRRMRIHNTNRKDKDSIQSQAPNGIRHPNCKFHSSMHDIRLLTNGRNSMTTLHISKNYARRAHARAGAQSARQTKQGRQQQLESDWRQLKGRKKKNTKKSVIEK